MRTFDLFGTSDPILIAAGQAVHEASLSPSRAGPIRLPQA